ncbi:MAG: peroxide stress protein YaaA, partial [Rhodospirillales bacterium]
AAVQAKTLNVPIIQPMFKEIKGGEAKIISFLAKKARGVMSRYIIKNRINEPEELKGFSIDRYTFDAAASTDEQWVFTRKFIPMSEQR